MQQDETPFWRSKRLDEMSASEWESLCDGCGKCCLLKLEDEDTGDVYLTRLACRLLDHKSCRCKDYPNRFARMPGCVSIDAGTVGSLRWLPETCAYRLIDEGKDLFWWHPLVSGEADSVHWAGESVRGWATCESRATPETMERFIISRVD